MRVQALRRVGDLAGAYASIIGVVQRNPRLPNAWLQKARLEGELRIGVDTTLASLSSGASLGESKALVSSVARGIAQTTARDTTMGNLLDPARQAIRYVKFAESVQANDTTALLLGSVSLQLGQRLAAEFRETRKCEFVKEAQGALVDAQISLPKAGATFRDQVSRLLPLLGPTVAYVDQLSKTLCKSPD